MPISPAQRVATTSVAAIVLVVTLGNLATAQTPASKDTTKPPENTCGGNGSPSTSPLGNPPTMKKFPSLGNPTTKFPPVGNPTTKFPLLGTPTTKLPSRGNLLMLARGAAIAGNAKGALSTLSMDGEKIILRDGALLPLFDIDPGSGGTCPKVPGQTPPKKTPGTGKGLENNDDRSPSKPKAPTDGLP